MHLQTKFNHVTLHFVFQFFLWRPKTWIKLLDWNSYQELARVSQSYQETQSVLEGEKEQSSIGRAENWFRLTMRQTEIWNPIPSKFDASATLI